jgi:hypothetical protein
MNNTNLTDTCKNRGQTPVLQKGGQFLLNRISLLNPYDSVIIKSFNDIAFSKFCFYWKYFNVIFSFPVFAIPLFVVFSLKDILYASFYILKLKKIGRIFVDLVIMVLNKSRGCKLLNGCNTII